MTDPQHNDPPQGDRRRIPPVIRAILADNSDTDSAEETTDAGHAMRQLLERQKQTRFAVLTATTGMWPRPGRPVELTADFGPRNPKVPLKLIAEEGGVFLTGDLPAGHAPVSLIQVLTELATDNPARSELGRHGRACFMTVPPPPGRDSGASENSTRRQPQRTLVLGASSAARLDEDDDIYPKPTIDADGTLHVPWFPAASDEHAAEVLVAEVPGVSGPVPFLAMREGRHQYLTATVRGFRDRLEGKRRIDLRIRPLSPQDWLAVTSPLSGFALANRQVESWTFASDSQPGRAHVFMPPDDEEADTTSEPQTTWLLGYLPETHPPKGDR